MFLLFFQDRKHAQPRAQVFGKAARQKLRATLAQLSIISPPSSSPTTTASAGNVRRASSYCKRAERDDAASAHVRLCSHAGAKKLSSTCSRDTAKAVQRLQPDTLDSGDAAPSMLRQTRGVTVPEISPSERSVLDMMLLGRSTRLNNIASPPVERRSHWRRCRPFILPATSLGSIRRISTVTLTAMGA